MLAALLPIGSAVLGGIQGYQQSEGDLGAAALGAGLGALGGGLLPGGVRMAGAALAPTAVGRGIQAGLTRLGPAAYKAGQAVAGKGASTLNPIAQQMLGRDLLTKGLTGAAVLGGATLIPSIAGGTATGTKRLAAGLLPTAGKATGTAEVVRGYMDRNTGQFIPDPTSPLGTTGLPTGPQTALDYLDPTKGAQGALAYQQQQLDLALRKANEAMAMERPYLDEAKTRDFTRNIAGARLASDLATQQGLILGGQQIAGTMGAQALADVGAGMRTQYRYL